jgi:hypothetical protein
VDKQLFTSGQLAQQVQAVAQRMQKKEQKNPDSKGFQRTPAFIYAAVQQVLAGASAEEATVIPKGGFTDVGQHTGSEARATAWPLVEQLLKVGGCWPLPLADTLPTLPARMNGHLSDRLHQCMFLGLHDTQSV